MPLFMTQFTYTSEGWRALVKSPQDRTEAFRSLFQRMGGRLEAHYFCFGEYDSILIAEAPNETAMTSVLLAVISDGHIKDMRTTVLMTAGQGVEAMRKAGGQALLG
jgi:uncharacterized protein with GYD domain